MIGTMARLFSGRFWVLLAFHLCFAGGSLAQGPLPPALTVPPLPEPKPFTELFRKLLDASPAEREKLLSGKSTRSREVLVKKLDEYKALPAQKRELKLSALDLRWYLTALLPMSQRQRADWMARMPQKDRGMVEERLAEWERLPGSLQQELLADNRAATVLSRLGLGLGSTDTTGTSRMPEIPRIEKAIADWRTLPLSERTRISEHAMTAQVEKNPFPRLTGEQRDTCLRAFQKYTKLTKEDRARFLLNAERWRSMTAQERLIWRTLTVPPPPPLPVRKTPPLPKTQ